MKVFLLSGLLMVAGLRAYSQEISEAMSRLTIVDGGSILIDDFENDTVGSLPFEWYNRDGKRKAVHPEESGLFHYAIRQEKGNKFLHYEHTAARHLNYPLINRQGLDIYENPILSWKWRVKKIPAGANEDDNDRNDTAASIYVVFEMGRVAVVKKVPKSIRYTWSSTLDEGYTSSKLFGNQKIVVVESGEDNLGKWIRFERNIVEDYRRLFGEDPPSKPLAILILSDGNSTNSKTIADYDEIMLKKK